MTQTQKKRKKAKKPLPQILTPEEQAALLKRPNPRYRSGRRNHCLLLFMLSTGLRLAEVTALKWRDINMQSGRIHVHRGKGAKDRVIWCPACAPLDILRAWREEEGEYEYVFTSRDGKPLGERYIQRMLARYAADVGIDRPVSPHLLRHTFASDLYRESGSLVVVQAALGHASLRTTEIYLHVANGQLETAMRRFRCESTA